MKCVCDLRLYKYYLKINYSDCDYCEHGICYLDLFMDYNNRDDYLSFGGESVKVSL